MKLNRRTSQMGTAVHHTPPCLIALKFWKQTQVRLICTIFCAVQAGNKMSLTCLMTGHLLPNPWKLCCSGKSCIHTGARMHWKTGRGGSLTWGGFFCLSQPNTQHCHEEQVYGWKRRFPPPASPWWWLCWEQLLQSDKKEVRQGISSLEFSCPW